MASVLLLFPTSGSHEIFPVQPSQLLSLCHSCDHSLVTHHRDFCKSLVPAVLLWAPGEGPALVLLLLRLLHKRTLQRWGTCHFYITTGILFSLFGLWNLLAKIAPSLLPATAGFFWSLSSQQGALRPCLKGGPGTAVWRGMDSQFGLRRGLRRAGRWQGKRRGRALGGGWQPGSAHSVM